MNSLKDWALYYAGLGLAVFPLRPGSKKPATDHGFKEATTNLETISRWWDKWPDANIGIATGKRSSGLVVIDLDEKPEEGISGYETLKEWQSIYGKLPESWLSITGSGGYHYFYKDGAVNKCRTGLYPGVDIRGDGGYIVAPPSVHENGRCYEWEQAPEDLPLAAADDKVIRFLLGPSPDQNSQGFQMSDQIPEGQRVSTLVKLIGSQRGKGLSTEAIRAAVTAENEARCVPPLTEQELEKEVFPALTREWKTENAYSGGSPATTKNGVITPKKKIQDIEGAEFLIADLPPVVFLVDGLLSQGLGGLSAKSKMGKSWLALQLAVDLVRGDNFLGFTTHRCGVLYIDLENALPLAQDRLRKVLSGRELPKDMLYFWHESNLIGEGFENDLNSFLERHTHVKLVIIDVLQKIKKGKKQNQTEYEYEYEILTTLKQIADAHAICIYPVYHNRKMVDPTDEFSNMLGSTALLGASDFTWILSKEKREDKEATLAVTGRTIMESRYKLKRDGVKWENLGDAKALEETRRRREYDNDPVVRTIRRLVFSGGGSWRGRVSEIISSSQYFSGSRIYDSSQKVGKKIKELEKDLENYDAIHHSTILKGTASCVHVFETFEPENEMKWDDALS